MKVYPADLRSNIAFKRHLTKAEEKEMVGLNNEAKELLGNTGNSVLVIHDACLPQSASVNTGVANLLGKDSAKFFDFAKTYFGINTIQVFPQGEFIKAHESGLVSAYSYSALGLNNSLIDLDSLTQDKWRNILLPEEFKAVVDANTLNDKARLVNFENINAPESAFQAKLKTAFNRFLTLDEDDSLRVDFEKFKRENDDWLTPKAVYSILKKENGGKENHSWSSALDKSLYDTASAFSETERQERINNLLQVNKKHAEFVKFKQFVAEQHLDEARGNLHKKGLKLFGDMPIKFSFDEIWANPKAFLQGFSVRANDWCAPCLNYQEAVNDKDSAAAKLLKRKASLSARRYDGTRIDVSWMYVTPKIINNKTGESQRLNLGDTLLTMIEDEIKRVQGSSFSLQNIIHEFKAGSSDFSMFKEGSISPVVSPRMVILESENMTRGWGYNDYYTKTLGFTADGFIYGPGDHTSQPLVQIADGMVDAVERKNSNITLIRRDIQAPVLAELFNEETETMLKPSEFIRAKFADIMTAKHNFMFYMDPLGRSARFDSQCLNRLENYRWKVSANFLDDYHKSLQKGRALNLPDVLAKALEKEGLHEEHKDLYEKLLKFAKILEEEDPKDVVDSVSEAAGKSGGKKLGLIVAGVVAVGLLTLCAFKKTANKEQ